MVSCQPTCAIPSCASAPIIGIGSGCYGGYGYGSGYGYGYGSGSPHGLGGGSASAASLGVLSGLKPSCINQLPPQECVIQPNASVVTFPGAILSSSCEPLAVGGYAPCAVGVTGFGGLGSGLYGRGYRSCGSLGGRGIICDPCH